MLLSRGCRQGRLQRLSLKTVSKCSNYLWSHQSSHTYTTLPALQDRGALALPLQLAQAESTAASSDAVPESQAATTAAVNTTTNLPEAEPTSRDAAAETGSGEPSTSGQNAPSGRPGYRGFKPYSQGRDPAFDKFPISCEGMCRSATQRDIARAFGHIGVHPRQCRVQLDDFFQPVRWFVTFQTKAQQIAALRSGPYPMGSRRMYVEMTSMHSQLQQAFHPFAQNSRGRFIFISDIQENATMTDLIRFVEGYPTMESGLTFLRVTATKKLDVEAPQQKVPRHRAVVRFMSAEIAARAVRNLHGQYLLNTPVAIRLIH